MYLAPLNYDRYFKKVFSDLSIAMRMLAKKMKQYNEPIVETVKTTKLSIEEIENL